MKNKTFYKDRKIHSVLLIFFFAVFFSLFICACREDGTSDHFFGENPPPDVKPPAADWKMVGDIDFMLKPGRSPILHFNYLVPHLAFINTGNFSKVSVGRFDGFLWRLVNEGGASFTSADYYSFVIYKNVMYVAYTESSEENRISVTGFINDRWQYIGKPGFTHKKANYMDFKISDRSNDKFYVAYCNGDNFDRPYAFMRYGEEWKQLGAAAISSASAKEIKLAVLEDTAYVAYIEKTAVNKISVLKYNKSLAIWEHIGAQAFSPAYAAHLNFRAIDGKLYIAYCDGSDNSKLKASYYDGSAWKSADGGAISDGPAAYCSLADYNGALYAAYIDYTKEKRITVMSNAGGKWAAVGRRNFSSTDIEDISLEINQNVPYVAYRDKLDHDKIMVWKYE
ncbi:MAG TPA: hypothetical protein PK467_03945 [Candidatus Wallbacteria bacterium]|nr:hypothetical protein [Candidatus Wallbacteria bacterium]